MSLWICSGLLGSWLLASAGIDAPRHWEPAPEVTGLRGASAVAIDVRSGRVAVGDRGGVRLFLPGVPAARVLRRGPVHDLAFGADGALHAATARGLFRIPARGDAVRVGLGPTGEATALRVAAAAGWVVAAGPRGLFVARDGAPFERPAAGVGRGAVPVVALARAADAEPPWLWWVERGALRRGRLAAGAPPRVLDAERFALPSGELAKAPREIVLGASGASVAVVAERRTALLRGRGFEVLSPPWPAGARAVRARATPVGVWVATSRGLVFGPGWGGPWRRAASPAGDGEAAAIAAAETGVWVAGTRGLLRARSERAPSAAPGGVFAARLRSEPTIQEVQAAVVRHQDLTGRRMRDLARRVGRRGWLPELVVRGAYGDLQRARVDRDQVVFSSGSLHDLLDEQSDHDRDWEAALELRWELGDVVYHPESIDVSRESREWVELRDEVLDEVNQLYFERRRVLLELAGVAPDSPEAARHRVRADELAAGLDAWTGGWFGARAPSLSVPGIPSPPPPEENHSP